MSNIFNSIPTRGSAPGPQFSNYTFGVPIVGVGAAWAAPQQVTGSAFMGLGSYVYFCLYNTISDPVVATDPAWIDLSLDFSQGTNFRNAGDTAGNRFPLGWYHPTEVISERDPALPNVQRLHHRWAIHRFRVGDAYPIQTVFPGDYTTHAYVGKEEAVGDNMRVVVDLVALDQDATPVLAAGESIFTMFSFGAAAQGV